MRAEARAALAWLVLVPGVALGGLRPHGEGPQGVFDRIEIRCSRRVDRQALRELLPLRPGVEVSPAAIEEARALLMAKGTFRSVRFAEQRRGEERVLRIVLEPRPVILSVGARGHRVLGRREMRRLIRLRAGQLYDAAAIEAAVTRIERRYRELGYEEASVQVEDRRRDDAVDLVFRVHEGKPTRVVQVQVEGDGETGDLVLEAVSPLIGEALARNLAREAERRAVRALRRHGYFEARVDTAIVRAAGREAVLAATFDPGPRFEITIEGNHALDRGDLLGLMDLEGRLVITDGTWRELGRQIEHAYHENGFARAKAEVHVSRDADRKRVRIRVREGKRYRVARVTIAGNHALPDRVLRSGLATGRRRWFPWPRRGFLVPEAVQADRDRIRYLYRKAGFEAVQVSAPELAWDRARGRVSVSFRVEEGPRTIVDQVLLRGFPQDLSAGVSLQTRVAAPLDPEAVEDDRQDLVLALARRGFTEAAVEVRIEREPVNERRVHATVIFEARPGEQRRVGRLLVQGNVTTRDRVVLRELPLRPGDALDIEAMLRGQGRIYRLGLFRSVTVRPLGAPQDPAPDVGARVVERLPGRFEFGGGFNTRDGLGGFVEIGHGNLGGMAREITARAQSTVNPADVGSSQFLLATGYRDPRLFGSPWRFSSNLLGERSTRAVDQFSVERVNLTASADRDITDQLKAGMEVQADVSNIFDVAPDARLGNQDKGLVRLVGPGPFLVYDGRDNSFAPSRGVFDSARLRYTLPGVSTVHLLKLSVQHTQFVPLPARLRFVYAVRGGVAGVLTGGGQIPIRERFFLGGRSTVRGFAENSVGPEGEDGNPIGGDLVLNVNLELRFPLLFGFEGAVFADGGGAFLLNRPADVVVRGGNLSVDNFRRSAGLGLRYMTPVGPVSLDWGFKLDRRGGESIGAVHFNIGSAF